MQLLTDLKTALRQRCPRCGQGKLFKPRTLLDLEARCPSCGLALAANDNGDGPIYFVVSILCILLGPAAVLTDHFLSPPWWVHAVTWPALTLIVTLLTLRPAKALMILLQYRHRPGDWEKNGQNDGKDADA